MDISETLLDLSVESIWRILLCGLGIYIAVIIFTRIFGKRSFSKMSSFDFAMTVAIGSVIAGTILSKDTSMMQGVMALLIIYTLQLTVGMLRRFDWVQKIVDNKPLLLMDGETILHENLRKGRVTVSDLRSKLREANVTQLSQVKAVVMETTGDILVLHKEDDHQIDDWIMNDVMR